MNLRCSLRFAVNTLRCGLVQAQGRGLLMHTMSAYRRAIGPLARPIHRSAYRTIHAMRFPYTPSCASTPITIPYRPRPSLCRQTRTFTHSSRRSITGQEAPSAQAYIQSGVLSGKKSLVDVKKVIVIGSGGLSIGQAGEFDYSGECLSTALCPMRHSEGLCNSVARFPLNNRDSSS